MSAVLARTLAFLLLPIAAPALAHAPGAAGAPDPLRAMEPLVLVPLLGLGLAYGLGISRLWARAGRGRGIPVWRAAAFALGLLVLLAALLSPLDAAAETSFALHMLQHMLLVVVAAPLLALGQVGVVLLTALPAALRGPVAELRHLRRVATVPVASALHGATLWLWHAPGPYEAALANDALHYLEHLTMLGTAALFWWGVLSARGRGTLGHGAGIAALFVTMLHTGLLGILITLAPLPLYASYATAAPLGALGPLEDQQVAGIVMLAGGFAYLAAGLALLALWLAAAERGERVRRAPFGTVAPPR